MSHLLVAKQIVLGVTGGIAAYKAAEFTRLLVKEGAEVNVVLTEGGARFITPATFQALSGNTVWMDMWDPRIANNMAHIDLTRHAAAIVIAPASADFLAKLAHGFADDLLSTLCLARIRAGVGGAAQDCPLIVAPAMNVQMWQNPATQRNIAQLRQDGVIIFGPVEGAQACGEQGLGRMLEPVALLEELVAFFQPKYLQGKRVLLTAGPTFEALDSVRGLTNLSSGKMGYALARAAREAGAEVTLVSGPVAREVPRGVMKIDVLSAEQMYDVVMDSVSECDIFIGVAAVADYRPAQVASSKIKKTKETLTLALVPNPDILTEVASLPYPPFCVGFAAETENLAQYALAKRQAKKLPLVVGNLVQDGLGTDQNKLILFDNQGAHPLEVAPKLELAQHIIRHISLMLK